jgi:hypothetical protein
VVLFAQTLVAAAAVYVAVGLVFAAAFVTTGVRQIDPSAKHAPIGFRLIIVPGTVALWPLLAIRWLRGQQPPAESTAHKRAAVRLASARARGEDRP